MFLLPETIFCRITYPVFIHCNLFICICKSSLSVASDQQLTIERSESFNQQTQYKPSNAHDGNYRTMYSPKDGEVAGNFLKLYLSQAYSIGQVEMTSRRDHRYDERMVNTEVRVYSTVSRETEVASCGKITGASGSKLSSSCYIKVFASITKS